MFMIFQVIWVLFMGCLIGCISITHTCRQCGSLCFIAFMTLVCFSPVKQLFAIHGCFHCVNIFPAECFLQVVFFHFETVCLLLFSGCKEKQNTLDIVLHNESYNIKANIWGITFIFFCFKLSYFYAVTINMFLLWLGGSGPSHLI